MKGMRSDGFALAKEIKAQAHALGFDLCGIAGAEPSVFRKEFLDWLARGFHGEMGYMARDPERRLDPRQAMPEAKSIVAVGMNYYPGDDPPAPDPHNAIFARYARNMDYHAVMTERLNRLLASIQEREPEAQGRVYVDTGPILEREVARRAGLGWFGKNAMLINTRRGSYFLLGELLLNLPLPPDEPAQGGCGTCTRCLDACPTGAIVRPFEVDSRRCISYLTIELKSAIPQELAGSLGSRIFGCDICQEVCPFNVRRSQPTDEPAFQPRAVTAASRMSDLLSMTEEEFREQFKGSPVKRAKRRGLLRNVAAALSTREDAEAIAALEQAHNDPEPLVREQAERSLQAIRERNTVRGGGSDYPGRSSSRSRRAT
jgi:epoxyqueuosine reductase